MERNGQRHLCAAWLDISNAFGSMPHGAVAQAARSAGVGSAMSKIIRDIISNNTTEIMTSQGPTDPIEIKAGIKQGCPLSGLLFNLAIDPIIRRVQEEHEDRKILAYADDMVLLASSPEELQGQLDSVEHLCGRLSLRVNPNKCKTVHVRRAPTLGVNQTAFKISGEELPRFTDVTDHECFLGTPVGFSVIPSNSTLKKIAELGLLILKSKLAPWQRLDALRTFVAPSALFHMRRGTFRKADWDEIDKIFRAEIKRTLSVPQEATNDYLYGRLKSGMCGVPCLSELSDVALIDSAFKLLRSSDAVLAETAQTELGSTVHRRTKRQPTADLLGRYLSGDNGEPFDGPSTEPQSTWSKARKASRRLQVEWEFEGRDPGLRLGDSVVESRHPHRVMKTVREECHKRRLRDLIAKPSQGKVIECAAADPISSHFIRDGAFTRFADWRFIHRARLALVPLNGYIRDRQVDTMCRRCREKVETLPHVLCHCMRNSTAYRRRHDLVVQRVVKAARSRGYEIISQDRLVPGTMFKPDIVIAKGRALHVVDVTVPFDNRLTSFRDARQAKLNKYEPLIQHYKRNFSEVSIEAVVIGALGSWDRANDKFLHRLCSKRYLRLMKKLAVSDVIRWSRDVYVEHITGRRQYSIPQDPLSEEEYPMDAGAGQGTSLAVEDVGSSQIDQGGIIEAQSDPADDGGLPEQMDVVEDQATGPAPQIHGRISHRLRSGRRWREN